MIGSFYVDCGDIIGQKHYFVRMEFILIIFVLKFVRLYQSTLQKTCDECASADKRI